MNFDFSEVATENLNRLIKLLRVRLADNGKAPAKDEAGNVVYLDSNIWSNDQLVAFLCLSLSEFNQSPPFTFFNFDETKFVKLFTEVLISGAVLHALASQALIERGREFTITDNGITFDPPNLSEMLNTQYGEMIERHLTKVKDIKSSISSFNP